MCEEEGYLSDQDIFAEDGSQCTKSPCTPQIVVHDNTAELTRLRSMMLGVPPPPEKTNPQIDISSMLDAWNNNIQLHWAGSGKKGSPKRKKKRKYEVITNRDLKQSDDIDLNSCETNKENSETSDVEEEEDQGRFDVYLNHGTEEEELLRQKVAERLISSETSSSFMQHVILTNSEKKRQRRNGWAKSPGSRLSYLAKRRTTFSQRPNLSNARTISLLKEDKKPQRKAVPLKRALFQSPDKLDFSTPDCSRVKRLKLSFASPKSGTPPRSEHHLNTKKRPSVSRNLETAFNTFVAQSNPELINPRQKQLWQRTPLASLSST